MMSEIKPCPFCGGRAEYWEDNQYQDRHVIECQNCGTTRRSEYGYDSVLQDWNCRYDAKGNRINDDVKPKFKPVIYIHRHSKDYAIQVWNGDVCDTEEEARDKSFAVLGDFFLSSGSVSVEMTK